MKLFPDKTIRWEPFIQFNYLISQFVAIFCCLNYFETSISLKRELEIEFEYEFELENIASEANQPTQQNNLLILTKILIKQILCERKLL